MTRNASARASSHQLATALLAIAGLSACGANGRGRGTGGDAAAGNATASPTSNSSSDVDDGGTPDAASNTIVVGDATGTLSCDDGAPQCGCANVVITLPLAPGALDAAAASDGGLPDCAALCPAMGGSWFSCEPTEGGANVRCEPECL
jgi:hypothetical protein